MAIAEARAPHLLSSGWLLRSADEPREICPTSLRSFARWLVVENGRKSAHADRYLAVAGELTEAAGIRLAAIV